MLRSTGFEIKCKIKITKKSLFINTIKKNKKNLQNVYLLKPSLNMLGLCKQRNGDQDVLQ